MERQIKDLENARVIRPSHSPWAVPVIVVSKKDQSMHLVVDYWKLNLVSAKDVYPLPNITTLLDSLGNAKYFSTLDLRAGYHQLSVAPEHKLL
ncbi:MAG: RNA-directed DNA polymerase [bacterium]|nr:RNA-directed DNA polymerase [bacterium]